MTKYKYYFKKPKSEIAKDIFKWLAGAGLICIAASSPYFAINLMRSSSRWRCYKTRNVTDTFKRLQKQGCIEIKKVGHQIYIRLTKEGKRKAGWMQIDALKIKKPKKWDRNWRLVAFDISQLKKFHREAFRGKLKELGFYRLQKSIWIYPFDCWNEIALLGDFFDLSDREMRLIISPDIGKDDWLKKHFKISY